MKIEKSKKNKGKSLRNNVARLERAGLEYSVWIEKLRKAVDELALFLDKTYGSLGGTEINLPGSFTFQSWPSHEYNLTGYMRGSHDVIEILLTKNTKDSESLLKFAAVIAGGWLDEVALHIERQTEKFREAAEGIERLTAK
ncbi:MAG: hypothetical protein EXS46_03990 [Candidatus Taylorbacteria bacterium]|nr:hypothetical protein [Candidatus Taylorbacteria bacterium]